MDRGTPMLLHIRNVVAAAVLVAAMVTSPVHSQAEEAEMYAVMVEFDVADHQTEAVLGTVEELLTDLVRHQAGFVQARLNREAGGAKVINYMLWEDADAFNAFRAEHKERIGQAISQYGPEFSFYNIAKSVEPAE
jgi:heme-degrading monooxygenase HmoA